MCVCVCVCVCVWKALFSLVSFVYVGMYVDMGQLSKEREAVFFLRSWKKEREREIKSLASGIMANGYLLSVHFLGYLKRCEDAHLNCQVYSPVFKTLSSHVLSLFSSETQ